MRRLRCRGVTPSRPGRPLPSRRAIALLLATLWSAGSACIGDAPLKGVAIDPPRALPAFVFTLPSGATFDTTPDGMKPTVLFFGYTHCPDVCPTTLVDWTRVRKQLGRRGDDVRFVFVTVDPIRDTPAIADRYAKQFDSTFVGVSGDSATTARIMQAFGVSAARESSTDSTRYLVSHSAQTFLVDAKGRLVAMYTFGMGWDALAADLESMF